MAIECNCEVCQSGQPINVQEWRYLNPIHQQIYDELAAEVESGRITANAEGDPNEDPSGLESNHGENRSIA